MIKPIYITSALVIIIALLEFFASRMQAKTIKTHNKDLVYIPKESYRVLQYGAVLGIGCMGVALSFMGNEAQNFANLFLLLSVGCEILYLGNSHYRVVIDSEGMYYTPKFGSTKHCSFDDMEYLMRSRRAIDVMSGGSCQVKLYMNSVNYEHALSVLKKHDLVI